MRAIMSRNESSQWGYATFVYFWQSALRFNFVGKFLPLTAPSLDGSLRSCWWASCAWKVARFATVCGLFPMYVNLLMAEISKCFILVNKQPIISVSCCTKSPSALLTEFVRILLLGQRALFLSSGRCKKKRTEWTWNGVNIRRALIRNLTCSHPAWMCPQPIRQPPHSGTRSTSFLWSVPFAL